MADQTTTADEGKTAIKFKDDLVAHSNGFKPRHTADAATGTIVLPEGAVFESDLAKKLNVTAESFQNHAIFTDLSNNALTHLGSEIAVDLFKQNKDLQTVTMRAPFTKNAAYEGTFNRKGTSRNPGDGSVSNYVGAIGVGRVNVTSTRTKKEWGDIKQNMRNLAEAAGLE